MANPGAERAAPPNLIDRIDIKVVGNRRGVARSHLRLSLQGQ